MSDTKYCKDCKNINCPEGRVNCKYPDAVACDLYRDTPQTVFETISQSPEALAQRLVYKILYRGLDRRLHPGWKSTIIYDADFYVRDEAVAATVAKLKEVGIE